MEFDESETKEILEQAKETLSEDIVSKIEEKLKEENKLPKFKVLSLQELYKHECPTYRWRVNNLVQDKKTVILAASSASFKSWFMINMGMAVAKGVPFLDNFEVEQGGVLFIDRENSIPELQNRVEMIANGMGISLEEDLPLYFLSEQSLNLDNLDGLDFLEKYILENNIKMVIVDTYRRVISFEENDANWVSKFFSQCIKPICEKTGVSFVFIHHHKKGKSEGDEKELLRGSSDLVNFVDGVIQINRKGNKMVVKQTKNRSGKELEPFELTIETDEQEYFKFNYMGKKQDISMAGRVAETILLWITKENIKDFRTKEAQSVCLNKGIKKVNFFAGIAEMEKRGLISKTAHGQYKVQEKQQDLEIVQSSVYKNTELLNKLSPDKSSSSNSSIEQSELLNNKSKKHVKIKILKDTEKCKAGEIVQTTRQSAESYVTNGYAEYVSNGEDLKQEKKKAKNLPKKIKKIESDRKVQFTEAEETQEIKTTCTKEEVFEWIKANPNKSYKELYKSVGEGSLRFKNELVSENKVKQTGNELEVVL